jgi:hypothetical protein
VSLPGLTGQSSTHGWWLLDRPVKPGDDSAELMTAQKVKPARARERTVFHVKQGPFNSEVQRIGLLSYTKIFFI